MSRVLSLVLALAFLLACPPFPRQVCQSDAECDAPEVCDFVTHACVDSLVDGGSDGGTGPDGGGGTDGGSVPSTAMLRIEGGYFEMGCESADGLCPTGASPEHAVILSPYEMDITEVTIAQYEACRLRSGCGDPDLVLCPDWDPVLRATHPASCVGWDDAVAYCAWVGKRLPSEAQWELAARGRDGRHYPWGESAPTCAESNDGLCGGGTQPVGERPAGVSPYGLLDLGGNVSEWVRDFYDDLYYQASTVDDPPGPPSGTNKVARGAGFRSTDDSLRTLLTRSSGLIARDDLGFRCARTLTQTPNFGPPPAGMVQLVAATFTMGCRAGVDPEPCNGNEPPHEVTLSGFWIDTWEVSNGLYDTCVTAGICAAPDIIANCDLAPVTRRLDEPVTCMSRDDAVDFCEWAGKRLPTEAEFERAMRSTDDRPYPWGTDALTCNHVNYSLCGRRNPWPVDQGSAGASAEGALNLAGNVAEVVFDRWRSNYPSAAAQTDPKGEAGFGAQFVVRGGSHLGSAAQMVAYARGPNDLDPPRGDVGFRCAWPPRYAQ